MSRWVRCRGENVRDRAPGHAGNCRQEVRAGVCGHGDSAGQQGHVSAEGGLGKKGGMAVDLPCDKLGLEKEGDLYLGPEWYMKVE